MDAADYGEGGRNLHDVNVLEGSVRSAGQQVLVNVALVDTRSGMRLWNQDFRGNLNDIFAIQDSIGEQVAAHVRRQLIRDIAPSTTKTSGEVYSLYVTARSLMRQREPGKIDAAADLLRQAVKLDPDYAPAWARLGLAVSLQQTYGNEDEHSPALNRAKLAYAEKAVAMAPRLADAHAILGLLLSSDSVTDPGKASRARAELRKAVDLDPNDAESWYWLHYLRLSDLDFAGALAALQHSASIDPFFVHNQHLPPLAWEMGYRDEAERVLRNWITNHPDSFMREIARAQLAGLHYDLSDDYQLSRAARDIAAPDQKEIAENRMAAILLQLGLLTQAEQYVPRPLVDLRRGKLTSAKAFRQAFPRASDFWTFNSDEDHLLPRVIVKIGRSRELVASYDEVFSSPDDMARRYSHYGLVLNAPLLAISLDLAGHRRDGVRLLFLADGMCAKALQPKHSPTSFRVLCSRVRALLGRKEEAIRLLQQAVSDGWRPSEGEYLAVTDEPAYGAIRNDSRMKRIDSIIAADITRQRRRLLAAGV
jgi:tetratricopeptide (TPR) repeat protein